MSRMSCMRLRAGSEERSAVSTASASNGNVYLTENTDPMVNSTLQANRWKR